jgi:hypothetical protein
MQRRPSQSLSLARRHTTVLGAWFVAVVLCLPASVHARPNTHALAISTWDTRASNIVFGYRRALFGSASTNILSYSANFASTSGILLAQFGLHYVSYRRTDGEPLARGVSAGGVALFSFPLSPRYTNGVAPSAFAFYVGAVPTALIAGRLNFLSVPGVLGVGVPLSPSPKVTLTPWLELSPGLNFDTRFNEVSTDAAIDAALDGTLTEAEVEDLVRQGLDANLETSLGVRGGLSAAFHVGERVDINADLTFGGGSVGFGGALVIRWDEMVRGVRPPGSFECEGLDARVRACRAARRAPGGQPRPQQPPAAGATVRPAPAPQRQAPASSTAPRPATTRPPSASPAPAAATPRQQRPPPKRAPAPPPAPSAPVKPAPAPSPSDAYPPLKAAPP